MWIAICDDEKSDIEKLTDLITDFAARNDFDIHCQGFLTGRALLECDRHFDMYFLDYQMSEINGLELEKRLREEKKVNSYISFVTAFPNIYVMQEAMKFDTHRFLFKPVEADPHKLYDALYSLVLPKELSKTVKLKKRDGSEDWITKEDIIYIQACEKSSFVATPDGTEEYIYLLKDIQSKLPPRFFVRIQKSFVINLKHVRSSNNGRRTVEMSNGDELPVGRSYFKAFNDAYLMFCADFK